MAAVDRQPAVSSASDQRAPAAPADGAAVARARRRNAAALVVVAAGVFLIAYLVLRPSGSSTAASLPLGSRAPDFSATTTTGATISLSELRGHAVLLNFWFTNCPPCRTEMPALQRVYGDLGRRGVVILGIDAIGEDAASISAFANPLGITYPLLLDPDQHVTRELYRVDSTPQSFFIDPQGVIRVEHTGPLTAAELQDGLSKLQAL